MGTKPFKAIIPYDEAVQRTTPPEQEKLRRAVHLMTDVHG